MLEILNICSQEKSTLFQAFALKRKHKRQKLFPDVGLQRWDQRPAIIGRLQNVSKGRNNAAEMFPAKLPTFSDVYKCRLYNAVIFNVFFIFFSTIGARLPTSSAHINKNKNLTYDTMCEQEVRFWGEADLGNLFLKTGLISGNPRLLTRKDDNWSLRWCNTIRNYLNRRVGNCHL